MRWVDGLEMQRVAQILLPGPGAVLPPWPAGGGLQDVALSSPPTQGQPGLCSSGLQPGCSPSHTPALLKRAGSRLGKTLE